MAEKTYEMMIEEIEKVLKILDDKELPLEEAVAKYKEGMGLIDKCSETLTTIEKDLKVIENESD